jgi:hypothetical protein
MLETDSTKQNLLTKVVFTARSSDFTDEMIGMLESYAALETDSIQKKMVRSILQDLMARKGKW